MAKLTGSRTPASLAQAPAIPPATLASAQELLLGALEELDRICTAHNLTYWLDSGTLLGAVRYGGFIPWDDDVDVAMPAADFAEFCRVAPAEVAPRYFVQTDDSDPAFAVNAMPCKIRIGGTYAPETFDVIHALPAPAHEGLFVDVFPMGPCPSAGWRRRASQAISLAAARKRRAAHMVHSPGPLPRVARLQYRALWLVPGPWVRSLAERVWQRNARLSRDYRYGYCYDAVMRGGWSVRPEDIFPTTTIAFAGRQFRAPANPQNYLREAYGPDYLTPPPPEQRHTHFWDIQLDAPDGRRAPEHPDPVPGDRDPG